MDDATDTTAASRQARDKLAAARVWLMKHKPFFGVLARALRLEASVAVPALRLLAGDRLLFNPLLVLECRFPTLCVRVAHVAMHAALSALTRRREREPRRWNVAHDLAIAPLLEAAELGAGSLHPAGLPELPPGAAAEIYFDLLPAGVEPHETWCDLSDPPDGPSLDAPSAQGYGHELEWSIRLAAAYEEELASGGATFGDTPGWLDEWVRATIEPPAHWSVHLQQAVASLERTDRSYLRPSRRMGAVQAATGVVTMPGRRIRHAGQLVAVVDTSASIPLGTLARFFGVIAAVAAAEGIDHVRLLQADAAITSDETVFAAELSCREVAVAGRGGTDYEPALALLDLEARRTAEQFTAVYLTDLDGRFPSTAPTRVQVLWVVPRRPAEIPPFGVVLEMGAAT